MRVTGFNHIGLNAAGKHDEVKEFYTSVLGLGNIEREGAATLVNGFWFGQDHPIVHVVTDPEEGDLAMPNNTHLSLFVEDIDAAVTEVKGMTDDHLHFGEGGNQIIWFKDPAGNTIELQQDPASAA